MPSSPDVDAKKIQSAINQLVLLRMDYTEMACLKTIVLFRPGVWCAHLKLYQGIHHSVY